MYVTELDIGSLTFISEERPDGFMIARFLEAYQPPHVYTDIKADKHKVSCVIMDATWSTEVCWKSSTDIEIFEG